MSPEEQQLASEVVRLYRLIGRVGTIEVRKADGYTPEVVTVRREVRLARRPLRHGAPVTA